MPETQVKIYSTPTCPWCVKTKQFLELHGIKYQNLDVAGERQAREEMIKKTGQLSVPQVEIDGEVIVGYNEEWMKKKLGLDGQKS